jgi:hypothetical protein
MLKLAAAMLAAANAAASIAAINWNLQNHDERLAALLCTIGFLVAVAAAAFDHLFRRRAESPDLELRKYWTQVDFTGERNPHHEAMLEDRMREASRFVTLAPVTAAVSALLLVAGVTLITVP